MGIAVDIAATLASLGICAGAAAIEGLCSGLESSVLRYASRPRPKVLRSAPSLVRHRRRLLRRVRVHHLPFTDALGIRPAHAGPRDDVGNALWNLIFFRAKNLCVAFLAGSAAPLLDIPLFVWLLFIDPLAAWALVPYLAYRAYAV
jgi:TspO/MBR family protein